MIDDNKNCLAICNPKTAKAALKKSPDLATVLVVLNKIADNKVLIIPEDEFIDYLESNSEVYEYGSEKNDT